MAQAVATTDRSRESPSIDHGKIGARGHSAPESVLIEAGSSFEGLLSFNGHARVDGEFRGRIATKGRIELGERARVAGSIDAAEVVIAGAFEGEIVAYDRLDILASARIDGRFSAARLSVAEGASIRADCRTVPSGKESKQSPSAP